MHTNTITNLISPVAEATDRLIDRASESASMLAHNEMEKP